MKVSPSSSKKVKEVNGMKERIMEKKPEHLVQSLKSSVAVSSFCSVKKLASAKTDKREENVRKIVENYGDRR